VAVVVVVGACTGDDGADEPSPVPPPRVVVGTDIVGAVATAALGEDAVVEVVPGDDALDRALLEQLAPIPFGESPAWAAPPAPSPDRPALGSPDPAFWLDPDRVTQAARLLADGVDLSPDARLRTDARIEELAETMRVADERAQAMLITLPPARLQVATANVRLGYHAERYGLVIVPTDGDLGDADPLAGLDVDRLGPPGTPTDTLDGLLVEVARRIAEPST
jgi:ABC-type Zn uptake system ZnuABC Zn-binding protein ZnuA